MSESLDRLKAALADRYAIEREIGSGGMATVYLAHDLRHERQVAVKVLRPEVATTVASERFLQEVRVTANLTHPHILPLFDSGEANGFLYFVMPYIEGESLRERLLREKQLTIDEVLQLTQEIGDGLDYAHQQGIVHRDIKPENILLARGHALIADFGVARAVAAAGGGRLTTTGASVGTPLYMSPEQASGDSSVDHRADIYSFGCVLYEMLAGAPPFTGATAAAVMAKHAVESRPSVKTVRDTVPEALDEAIQRAMAKVPADRPQTVAELLTLLESIDQPRFSSTPRATPIVSGRRWWIPWAAIGTVAVLGAAVGLLMLHGRSAPLLPQPLFRQLTYEGNVRGAELSPDGQLLAYVSGTYPLVTLKVQDLVGGSSLVLADSIHMSAGHWSPDGSRFGLSGVSQGVSGVYLFPRLGGAPRRTRLPGGGYFAWSPRGDRIAEWWLNANSGIQVYDLESDKVDSLSISGTDQWLGVGEWNPRRDLLVLVTRAGDLASAHVLVVNLSTGEQVTALTDSTGAPSSVNWAPKGDAIYLVQHNELYRVPVDPRSGRATGPLNGILRLEGGTFISLSRDGKRLAYTRAVTYANLSVVRGSGSHVEQVVLTKGTAARPCLPVLSPDGTDVAFVQESSDGGDLYRVPATGGTPQRLTFDGSVEVCPAWGPIGERLAYGARVGATIQLAIIPAGGGSAQIVEKARVGEWVFWAPSKELAYQLPGNRNFRLFDPETGEDRLLVRNDSLGWMFGAHVSPDRSRVAVYWNRRPDPGLWLISLRDSSQTRLVPGDWVPLDWSADGRSIYAVQEQRDEYRFQRIPIAGGKGVSLPTPRVPNAFCLPDVRPQGFLWLCRKAESLSDVWMIEDFDPEYAGGSH